MKWEDTANKYFEKRIWEIMIVERSGTNGRDNHFQAIAIYNLSYYVQTQALLSLCRTVCLILILFVTVTCLNKATNELLILPIE